MRYRMWIVVGLIVAGAAALGAGVLFPGATVSAAGQGTGFGTWAPRSEYGWHGSMLINGTHTYCISPGEAAPVGPSADRGVSTNAHGMSAQQLAGINLLVSRYGQTGDASQAAAVAWAVRSIADWNASMHTYGYPGNDLRGAIHWSFSALSPAHDERVQQLATAYYDEAMRAPTSADGRLTLTTDQADAARGTVRIDTALPDAAGSLSLENAVFDDTGSPGRDDARPGVDYPIRVVSDGHPVTVSARASLRGGYAPAVRHYTTEGGQDTAGPGGPFELALEAHDQTPRVLSFAPIITTTVAARYLSSGSFVDDVTFASAHNPWPRDATGYLTIRARATVYRTDTEPVLGDAIPPEAQAVGVLTTATEAGTGPHASYRVEPDWMLPGPGFYTAVWEIRAAEQPPETKRMLPPDYSWRERFGEQSQVMLVTRITSQARTGVAIGEAFEDSIIVEGSLPREGIDVSAAVYRAAADPGASCTPENLVWDGVATPIRVGAPGRVEITGPAIADFGTYYWQERAVDAQGRLIHLGACGVENETTRAPLPTVVTSAPPTVGFGAHASDVAIVSGPVPRTGHTELVFSVFRGSACATEELVADTKATPVTVTGEGVYASPSVPLEAAGPHYWVERLTWTPADSGIPRELARGVCGAAEETTVVSSPTLETRADARAVPGEAFADTATVAGLDPAASAELVFETYRSTRENPECTAKTLENRTAPVSVRGDGDYRSPEVRSPTEGVVLWVAELHYLRAGGERVVLQRGSCGDPHESTTVSPLAVTGTHTAVPYAAAAGGLLAVGGLLLMIRRRFGTRMRNG